MPTFRKAIPWNSVAGSEEFSMQALWYCLPTLTIHSLEAVNDDNNHSKTQKKTKKEKNTQSKSNLYFWEVYNRVILFYFLDHSAGRLTLFFFFLNKVSLIQIYKCCFCFRYFTLFMNLLNDCSEVEDESAQTGGRKRGMSRRLASLRHCTVLAMSNLLNANVDSGLMHSIGKVVRNNCLWFTYEGLSLN